MRRVRLVTAFYGGMLATQVGVLAYQLFVAWLILTWTDIDIDVETMRSQKFFQLDRWPDLILIALILIFSTAVIVGLLRRRRWPLLAGLLGPLQAFAMLVVNITEPTRALLARVAEAATALVLLVFAIVYPLSMLWRDGWKLTGRFDIHSRANPTDPASAIAD